MNDDYEWLWLINGQWIMINDEWSFTMNENDGWCKNGNELNDELIMNLECYVLSTEFFW